MKKIFTLLLFIIASNLITAQCEFPNGSFENWTDLTPAIDPSGNNLPANTLQIPVDAPSAVRFLLMFFETFNVTEGSPEYYEIFSHGLGLAPDPDALSGNNAMKIGGDSFIPLADVFTVSACDEAPTMIQFSYKHVGTGSDTLLVYSKAELGISPIAGEFDISLYHSYVQYEIVIDEDQSEYTTVSVPYTLNPDNPTMDSLSTFIAVVGNQDYFDGGGSSHFLIDDVSYIYGGGTVDADEDGFNSDVDCDDSDPAINPDATEIANNDIDENCDGVILVIDADEDGFNSDDDCDDSDPAINPDATEIANNDVDENCDGVVLVIDADEDGFNSDEDCDDSDPAINPDATEIADNGIDEDCDGVDLISSVSDIDAFGINIFPNPVANELTIEVNKKLSLEIFTVYGERIAKTTLEKEQNFIQMGQYISGTYILKITDNKQNSVYKKIFVL